MVTEVPHNKSIVAKKAELSIKGAQPKAQLKEGSWVINRQNNQHKKRRRAQLYLSQEQWKYLWRIIGREYKAVVLPT